MTSPRHKTVVLAMGMAILLVAGLVQLHRLRYASGDIYPAYSTFRADPLGTKAFYESVKRQPGLSVDRTLVPLSKLDLPPHTTLVFLGDGVDRFETMPVELADKLSLFLEEGGRLVLTLRPWQRSPTDGAKDDDDEDEEDAEDDKEEVTCERCGSSPGKDGHCDPAACEPRWVRVAEWLEVGLSETGTAVHGTAQRTASAEVSLPPTLPCHTVRYISPSNSAWRVCYERDGFPVVLDRAYGEGRVVLSALSYVVSNEALCRERYPGFLAWMIGNPSNVVFDETHLGIQRNLSMAMLARSYRAEWVAGVLVLLAALFVWKNSVSIVPKLPDGGEAAHAAEGRGSVSGLVNLLRRAVPKDRLLHQVVKTWRESHQGASRETMQRIDELERTLNALPKESRKDVAGQYNLLRQQWKEERWKRRN